MLATQAPFSQYFDKNGDPLDSGYVYFGQPNQNPETSPLTVYWDYAGTQPVAQPARTLAGYIVRNGTPARVYAEGAYSVTVRNRKAEMVYYAATSADISNQPVNRAIVTATNGQTLVTVPFAYTRGNNSLQVFVNGLIVRGSSIDYTETTTTSITFTNGLSAGDEVELIGGILLNPVNTMGMVSDVALASVNGASLVGYSGSSVYPSGTVGYAIQQGVASGDYIGAWDADTNDPTLASGVGVTGAFYIVNVAGTTTLDGISSWAVGDQVRFDGTVWQKISAAAATIAANVTFTPAGAIAATDVQAALEELDTEKAPKASPVFTGNSLKADWSNATFSSRASLQTSTLNANTNVQITPNGTGTTGGLVVLNTSSPLNSPYGQLAATATDIRMTSSRIGSGTTLPFKLFMDGVAAIESATDAKVTIPLLQFTQAGTGAVARNQQDKSRDIVSVLDFAADGVSGAKVDRSGVLDSTLGIQAALDYINTAAFAQPASLFIPAGNYKITASLSVPSNVSIVGENNWLSRIVMHTATNVPILSLGDYSGGGHVAIRDLFLDYNSTPVAGADAIQITGAQTCTIDRVFVNGGYNGVAFYPGATSGVSGNHFISNFFCYNYKYCGVYIEDTIGVAMRNFQLAALSATGGAGGAIRMLGMCEGINISGGECQRGLYGLVITRKGVGSERTNIPHFNRFEQVFFDSAATNPVFLDYAAHTDFVGCWFASGGYTNDFGNLAASSGVLLRNASHIRFIGGDVINNGGYGAEIEATSTNISFSGGVTFRQNFGYGGGVADGPAVYVHPNTSNFSVTDCVFSSTDITGGGTSHQNASINIGAGTSDNYVITGNRMVSQPYTDSGTGTNKFISQNLGQDLPIYKGTYTPTVTSSSGTLTTVGARTARYVVRDGMCTVNFDCIVTTNGTGSGEIRVSLPFATSASESPFYYTGVWRSLSTGTSGVTYTAGSGLSYVGLVTASNAYPGTDGVRFIGSISYAI